jgi:hypothetical protein
MKRLVRTRFLLLSGKMLDLQKMSLLLTLKIAELIHAIYFILFPHNAQVTSF